METLIKPESFHKKEQLTFQVGEHQIKLSSFNALLIIKASTLSSCKCSLTCGMAPFIPCIYFGFQASQNVDLQILYNFGRKFQCDCP